MYFQMLGLDHDDEKVIVVEDTAFEKQYD